MLDDVLLCRLLTENYTVRQQVAELAENIKADYTLQELSAAQQSTALDIVVDSEDNTVLVCQPSTRGHCTQAGQYKVSFAVLLYVQSYVQTRFLSFVSMPALRQYPLHCTSKLLLVIQFSFRCMSCQAQQMNANNT